MWTESGVDLVEAAREIKKHNRTKMREETILERLQNPVETTLGYKEDGDFKHQMVTLGPFAEQVAARVLSGDDGVYLQPPDNNNDRDLYRVKDGKIQDGLQVKLGDPNEHIYYSLMKRIERGYHDDVVLDRELVENGRLGMAFKRYKKSRLQGSLDDAGLKVIGVPGLRARAETLRKIHLGENPLMNKVKLMGQNLYYSVKGVDR